MAGVSTAQTSPPQTAPKAEPLFREVATQVGLSFEHEGGRDGHYYFPEVMGSGVALFDADGDGDLDAYAVQGGPLTDRRNQPKPSDRFWLNRLEKGSLRFEDRTEAAGLAGATEYGMGVAVGDMDGDGDLDLFLANFGKNQLWRNRGDGTFEDVTDAAGVGDPRWSVSASWVDYDFDGRLDLYVANYVVISLEARVTCKSPTGVLSYCGPQNFTPERDQLLRNRGDGTFEDVSAAVLGAAWRDQSGAGLGVVSADFDADGRPEIYVANDLSANHLWRPQGSGWIDDGALAGCALSGDGEAEASMGLLAEDLDEDGDVDLFISHLDRQTNTFYRNEGSGFFADAGLRSGLGNPSWNLTGFGLGFLDVEGDGRPDLFVANGRVTEDPDLREQGAHQALRERNQLFRGLGSGRFEEVLSFVEGAPEPEVGRGVAVGDVDNDGDADLLITNNHGPIRLLQNVAPQARPWAGLSLRSARGETVGASLWVEGEKVPPRVHRSATDGSYGSARDPRILLHLDKSSARRLWVRWPNGEAELFSPDRLPWGRYGEWRQGSGSPPKTSGPETPDSKTSDRPPWR